MSILSKISQILSPGGASRISPAEAAEKIRSGALVLDVRSHSEFAAGHLPRAVNIPHTDIISRVKEIGGKKDQEIIVYCRSGGRADSAKSSLEQLGFTKVFNAGGYASLKS